MSVAPRLLGLRLQGFKSFAERTLVEFDGGISAVVGPNGSGKSNLADALRWALGEQGRSLRTRKSEDVIFAGSERRAAIGMADVTLVIDNADGLLPVDYSVLEIGRRLYRSGENDYLLNKQRIRLRDLVDLLDAAHLADNAFLFIGQGMVDQALALRPEERRPLFEEVAGVRRHERRRKRAEEQLLEAEANLARVEDILGELRPQARRLAAQADQQTSRRTAGEEFATALLASAHARWHEASRRADMAAAALASARTTADRPMADLQAAEEVAAAVSADLGERAAAERDRRSAHDLARTEVAELRVRQARVSGELEALGRDRVRLATERDAAEADAAAQRRILAEPLPVPDLTTAADLAGAEHALAEALAELGTLRGATTAAAAEEAAARRAAAARAAEVEAARRRTAEAERRVAEERVEADRSAAALAEHEARLVGVREALAAASMAGSEATAARETARATHDRAEAERHGALQRSATAEARRAALAVRHEGLRARLAEDEERPIARAARRRGGRRIDEGLVVDPAFRAAVELAIGEAGRGFLIDGADVPTLIGERGAIAVRERVEASRSGRGDASPVRRAMELGGGRLADAVRADPGGVATALLSDVVWVPDMDSLLMVQADLPLGWSAVVRDGSAAAGAIVVSLGRPDGMLERRDEADRLAAELAAAEATAERLRDEAEAAIARADTATRDLEAARTVENAASAARRRAEEEERILARWVEAAARESAWHAAQLARLDGEAARDREALAGFGPIETEGITRSDAGRSPAVADPSALSTWQSRAEELRVRRDRLAGIQAESDRTRREAEGRRARAEAAVAFDETRIARVDADLAALAESEESLRAGSDRLAVDLGTAEVRAAAAAASIAELVTADESDRERLATAERSASAARERLRAAEASLRAAEVADLEARLALESVREGLLVELAGLGEIAVRAVVAGAMGGDDSSAADGTGEAAEGEDSAESDDGLELATALATIAPRWARTEPPADAPSAGRLAHLRRRYHELGAGNPFAVDEFAEVKARLDGLETQERDLRAAIADTRRLIDELSTMIADQFRTTFAALEAAFDARFRQLFQGGFARLSLTDPTDLAATGVEIVARPPGKKAQALAMLSGGERALTAVALLFAMLEVRPVPFCVLDEVDAALDEANVGHFATALRSLAESTQFIVITHNRGTIEAADALYGVTVGDDSVSRVISLRLDEATAIAERAGDDVSRGGRAVATVERDDVLA
jgi:chromosome segregation protein